MQMKIDILLYERPSKTLEPFLELYCSIHNNIDIKLARNYIIHGKKYYDKVWSLGLHPIQAELEEDWYNAIYDKTVMDDSCYECYNHDYYFTDLWVCWTMYSRGYLRTIEKENTINGDTSVFDYVNNINTVVDLGCGIGYTTASLKQMFPNAKVYGTNIEDTKQYKFAEALADIYDFNMAGSIYQVEDQVDFLFASEYFEHIYNPLAHIQSIVAELNPRYMYIANSFNTVSIGHFTQYCGIPEKQISRIFNKTLISLGYKRVKTKVWNNKPAFWERL
jgi:SAM-dependent methyltransferase